MKIVCLSCTVVMYLIVCSKKFSIFHDKTKDRKNIYIYIGREVEECWDGWIISYMNLYSFSLS